MAVMTELSTVRRPKIIKSCYIHNKSRVNEHLMYWFFLFFLPSLYVIHASTLFYLLSIFCAVWNVSFVGNHAGKSHENLIVIIEWKRGLLVGPKMVFFFYLCLFMFWGSWEVNFWNFFWANGFHWIFVK